MLNINILAVLLIVMSLSTVMGGHIWVEDPSLEF